jgi:hypothetical protein
MYLLITAALFFLPIFIQNTAAAPAAAPAAVAHSEDCPHGSAAVCNTDLRKREEQQKRSEGGKTEYIHVTGADSRQFAHVEGKRSEEEKSEGSNVSLRPSKRWGGYEGSRCCGSSGGWGRHGCCGNRW